MTPPPAPAPAPPQKRQIVIVTHSNLFYWWPVWALGFILSFVSMVGERMAIVPNGTYAKANAEITIDGKKETRNILVLPEKAGQAQDPYLHVASSKNVGVLFVAVLLLVIGITNIPLRGLWSFIVVMFVVFMIIIFSIMEWWAAILSYFHMLDIRINAIGYFVISMILFVLWLVIFLFFDQQMYMIFEPGQLRVRQAIGDAETSYDTTGMTTQKQRSDIFRHWILGLGSGDLIVRTSGAHPTEIHMPNVLFIGRKHAEIEDMLRSREVIPESAS